MSRKQWVVVIMSLFAAGGCSQTPSTTATPAPAKPATISTAATLPTVSLNATKAPQRSAGNTDPAADSPASAETPAAASTEATPNIGDLFAPPKIEVPVVTKEPEPKPEPKPTVLVHPNKELTLPDLRLVGFTELDSVQALLSVDGKLNVIAAGESVNGIQLVAIEPPLITLKAEDHEFQMDLLKQPWFYSASDTPGSKAPDRKSATTGKRGSTPPGVPNRSSPNTPRLPEGTPEKVAPVSLPPTSGVVPPPMINGKSTGLPALPPKISRPSPTK